ncbi:unnamed protein product, partial [Polarella glacialis]
NPLAALDRHLHDSCIPCWCCCTGLAVGVPLDVLDSFAKCACCQCHLTSGLPNLDSGLCLYLLNCGSFYGQCKCPPTLRQNPFCACCGWRLRSENHNPQNATPMKKPAQQKM